MVDPVDVTWQCGKAVSPSVISWTGEDPLVVTVVFQALDEGAEWAIGRDLFRSLLSSAPWYGQRCDVSGGVQGGVFRLILHNAITLTTPAGPLRDFLALTYKEVPRDGERAIIEADLEKFLSIS